MQIKKVNLEEKFKQIRECWNPVIAAELNGQHVRLAKIKGSFDWHSHENEDEMFLVIEGEFVMELRNEKILLKEGEFIVIPRGTEHRPVAEKEAKILLFEPASTLNTGNNAESEFRRDELESI